MMRMRVSQSLQLAATLSLSTELRCRVLSRCCRANIRARPRVIGWWNQRQRATKALTARSMRATTLMTSAEERDQRDDEYQQGSSGEERERGVRDVRQVGVARDRRGVVAVIVVVLERMRVHLLVVADHGLLRIRLRLRHGLVEVAEEIVGHLLRRRVDQARADLRQL